VDDGQLGLLAGGVLQRDVQLRECGAMQMLVLLGDEVRVVAEPAAGVDDPRRGESPESHERVSTPLMVPDAFSARFETLSEYLRREEEEEAALGRDTFRAERALLDTLRTADAVSPPGAAESRS